MVEIQGCVFDMNPQVRKLQLHSLKDVQVHFRILQTLKQVLEVDYDTVLTTAEERFLFIGTLPTCLGVEMAYMDFANVREMVAYLRSFGEQVYGFCFFSPIDASDVCTMGGTPLCDGESGSVCMREF